MAFVELEIVDSIAESTDLKLYFNEKGIAKLTIGLAKGKKKQDKRESIKSKQDRKIDVSLGKEFIKVLYETKNNRYRS